VELANALAYLATAAFIAALLVARVSLTRAGKWWAATLVDIAENRARGEYEFALARAQVRRSRR